MGNCRLGLVRRASERTLNQRRAKTGGKKARLFPHFLFSRALNRKGGETRLGLELLSDALCGVGLGRERSTAAKFKSWRQVIEKSDHCEKTLRMFHEILLDMK